ncbi:DUF664 domain-containing protein [Streptomyces sp. SID7499]|uniref:DUF664 domain-containing protein n=1 Tax=Streptomyces sp. SID7499 TaxID=2706086 RepID=A0A6G3XPV3_9ACTN|nr:DUF664 domain-containing protein [Streptomyces sp. SID7499]
MTPSSEKTDLLAAFAEQRALLLITVRGLTDAQAGRRTTVSELTLGGIVKHLATGEEMWTRIMSEGDGELPDGMFDMAQYRKSNRGADRSALTGGPSRHNADRCTLTGGPSRHSADPVRPHTRASKHSRPFPVTGRKQARIVVPGPAPVMGV